MAQSPWPSYAEGAPFVNGLARVLDDRGHLYINRAGDVVWPRIRILAPAPAAPPRKPLRLIRVADHQAVLRYGGEPFKRQPPQDQREHNTYDYMYDDLCRRVQSVGRGLGFEPYVIWDIFFDRVCRIEIENAQCTPEFLERCTALLVGEFAAWGIAIRVDAGTEENAQSSLVIVSADKVVCEPHVLPEID